MIWMVMAILMSAILTSTMTDAFYGPEYLDIYHQNIVAKNSSNEAWIAKHDYKAKVNLVPDYKSFFEAIRSKRYMTGVINSDVLSYYQEAIRAAPEPLRVVKRLPKQMPVSLLYSKSVNEITEYTSVYIFMNSCLVNQIWRDIIIEASVDNHRGYIKYDSFDEGGSLETFLTKNIGILLMVIIAVALVSFSIIFEVIRRCQSKKKAFFDVEKENRR